MTTFIPNRVSAGKSTGGQFTEKVNSESDLDLPSDTVSDEPVADQPQLTNFGLTMLRVAADNYRDAGQEVPSGLAERIRQGENAQAEKEAAQQAHSAAQRVQEAPTPEAKPEVIHDLTTDQGRALWVQHESAEKDRLLELSNEARHRLSVAEMEMMELRRSSYKGVSFDRERLEKNKLVPLRKARSEAEEAHLKQTQVWSDARDYAEKNLSKEATDRRAIHRAARDATFKAKMVLHSLIHNGGTEEEKAVARAAWHEAFAAEQALKA